MKTKMHFLFSYGTLQIEKVQIETYGHLLKGEKDRLLNYQLDSIRITDVEVLNKSSREFHPIALKTNSPNDCIDGTLFEITEAELEATDKYEVGDYKRVLETFSSGKQAWVYVAKDEKPVSTIANNINKINDRIKKACDHSGRDVNDVKLLFATKTVDAQRIEEAFECGATLIAENKVQEIKKKYNDLQHISYEQHFIGHLQTNKVKEILKYNISCIQTLDRMSLAEKLHRRLALEKKTIEVFVQVNTSNEESKFGLAPNKVLDFIQQVSHYDTLQIKGLMTIGLFSSDKEKVRDCFKLLKSIQQEIIKAKIPNVEMNELSMGMSGDLEIAIEEGATIIRVGTAVFGERQYPDSYYWNENSEID